MTAQCFGAAHCCCCYSQSLSLWCTGWHLLLLAEAGENILPVCYLGLQWISVSVCALLNSALFSDLFACEPEACGFGFVLCFEVIF